MILTTALAIWGAGLSTLLAILEVIKFRRDRIDIKITVRGGYKVYPKENPYGDTTLLSINVANKGKRPVTIKKAGLLLPRGSKTKLLMCGNLITASKPVELTEGRAHDYNMDEDQVKRENSLTPDKYIAWAQDSTGRIYWSRNFLVRLIKLQRIG